MTEKFKFIHEFIGILEDLNIDYWLEGGTALAAIKLFRRLDAKIVGCGFLVDLPDLGGAARIAEQGVTVRSLCTFEGH